MKRLYDDEESHEQGERQRQAGIVGVAGSAFGRDVLEGREERMRSLENGPRKTLVLVDGQSLATATPETVDHMAERQYPRRVSAARELREAADLAEQGIPLPGTLAYAKIKTAEDEGDFALASQLRERVKQFAPMLREAAVAAEQAARDETNAVVREARVTLSAIDRAKQKRERKAARRLREAGQ